MLTGLLSSVTSPILNRILGGALAGALIFSGVQTVRLAFSHSAERSAKEVILRLGDWQAGMVHTVQLASGSPKVTADTAQAQVQAMGQSLVTLNTALKQSNDAVEELAAAKRAADAEAKRERQARAAAIAKANQLAGQLRASAAKSVTPEEMEKEVRRVQDLAYDAGL